MFLKAFLMFSCLVLYTALRPTTEGPNDTIEIELLKKIIQINCSNSFIQKINWAHASNLCTTRRDMFCQIRKALNNSSCTESNILTEYLHHYYGNATCTLVDNGVRTNMKEFLKSFKNYLTSLRSRCKRK